MLSSITYHTIKSSGSGIYKEKGSKFIGMAVYCENEEQAKEILATWKNEHNKARHLCYAYRFGIHEYHTRSFDDGEPSNSAGAPILGQIQSFELTNVLIGVVRYYGGVKLGVGGLVNAYRTAAKLALEESEIVERKIKDKFEMSFDYSDMPFVMEVIKSSNVDIQNQEFKESCFLQIANDIETTAYLLEQLEKFETLKIHKIEVL